MKELVKAMNRLSRAIEKNNNEKVQRQLARAKIDEYIKTLEDEALVHKVTAALEGIIKPQTQTNPLWHMPLGQTVKPYMPKTVEPLENVVTGGTGD